MKATEIVIREANRLDIDVLVNLLRSSFRDVAERFGITKESNPKSLAFCTNERIESDLLETT